MNTFRVNNKRTSKSEKRTAVQSYQDSVDSLRKIFNRLNLIVYGEGAVRFADPEIFRILTTEKAYCDYNPDTGKIGYLVPIDRDGDGMMTHAEL